MSSQPEADVEQPGAWRKHRSFTVNGAIGAVLVAVLVLAAIADLTGLPSRGDAAVQARSSDPTSRMVAIVESEPNYVMDFAADFGGDPQEYLSAISGAPVDFGKLTVQQVGNAFRQFVEAAPPAGMPADLSLRSVNWGTVGGRVEQVMSAHGPGLFSGSSG